MNLTLEHIHKSFGPHKVLDDISLTLRDAQGLVLIGPSGGGKSTLLRILAALERPDLGSGPVAFDGRPLDFHHETSLREHRRGVGTVFQAYNLFPHFTALENVTLPLVHVHGHSPATAKAMAMEALERFHLDQHCHKRPAELSGGQRQRVAIARAIAIKPSMLFFDEPTSALDPEMTGEVLEVIEEIKEEGKDFVLVTHEMGFARRLGVQVALLAGGRIVETGPAEEIFTQPREEVTQRFLAKILRY
ncbi:MAG: amino acid ABC transporter ATP-binding protein [Verrucomicrobia bacterium]|nr:amino acid ABC transporter ATP-binding protein [Verrucomicrobiota bacterium]